MDPRAGNLWTQPTARKLTVSVLVNSRVKCGGLAVAWGTEERGFDNYGRNDVSSHLFIFQPDVLYYTGKLEIHGFAKCWKYMDWPNAGNMWNGPKQIL